MKMFDYVLENGTIPSSWKEASAKEVKDQLEF